MTVHIPTHSNAFSIAGRAIVEDRGQGILSIRLVRDESADAIAQLHDALEAAATRDSLKVVLLAGLGEVFSEGGRAHTNALIERGLAATLSGFPYPLIAEMPGDGLGPALLLAALCDVVVCSETGRYGGAADDGASNVPTPAEYALAEARFGPVFAAELLTAPHPWRGHALRDKRWCCPVVPEAQVSQHAATLAVELANKSQDGLRLLKHHLAAPLRERSLALATSDATPSAIPSAAVPRTLGKHCALRDEDGEVLLLTLRRGGKRHGTRAVAQQLQAAFAHDAMRSGHRAIVLASEYPGFLPESDASAADEDVLALMQALLSAPLPVVAVAGGALDGKAWLALQCCDAVVYQDDGHYDGAALLSSSALAGRAACLFGLRMGADAACELLLTATRRTGAELAVRVPTLLSAPRERIAGAALRCARGWARWPHASVLAWKAARTQAIAADLDTCARADVGDALADAGIEMSDATPSDAAPLPMPLQSEVVSATLYPSGVVEVVMHDRASKNMLSPALVDGMAEAFAHIAVLAACKAVVLTGYDTYFCSGGTKDALRAIHEGKVTFTDDRTFRLPLDCPVPVIAAMQGHGIGAGLSLGLFCDVPLLSEESHYVSPYMGYGFTPGVGATLIVPERLGQDLARETLLSACEYEGSALKARGVALAVHARQTVREAAMSLAGRIARHPRADLVRMKRHLRRPVRDRLDAVCAQEVAMHAVTFVGRADTLAHIESGFGRGEEGRQTAVEAMANAPVVPAVALAPVAAIAPVAASGEAPSLFSIRATLLRLLARELHLDDDEIDHDKQYTDLGLDSITGVTWMRKINEHYALSLDATIVYTYPTVSKLAQHVKSLVESRGSRDVSQDFAELQTRKLSSFREPETSTRSVGIVLADVGDTPVAAPAGEAVSLLSIRTTLLRLLARELHLDDDEIDHDKQYTDLGLDSITGVTWMRKVNEQYALSLDATIVYTYPTVSKLAQHVKSLVESRTRPNASPDLAEQQARKLSAFRDTETPVRSGGIVLGNVSDTPAPRPVPFAASTDVVLRDAPRASFRQLTSWRPSAATLPAPEAVRSTAPAVPEDIAVIGMAGQFPMARDLEAFWQNLQTGLDCISEVSPERWDIDAYYQPGEPAEGKTNSRWLGQLEDYDRFDPLFFNISPAEARAMDPQQRVFLQTCWHSIEHAGYDPKALAGSRCGVFVGAAGNDYGQLSRRSQLSAHGFTGNAGSILAARIAYFLDLQGPCLTIDTACSASLVAIAAACDSLNAGASDIALAGGVYVGAGPTMHIMTAQSGMLSCDGRCHTFDHRANGFVPGEAVGVVMLKRLGDAERDGDLVHAVVRGWGVNQDGRTNGITAPNPASQTRLMRDVYRRHRIDPTQIQLVEAHGTATPLGDPIEIRGLADAFGSAPEPYCALGSVKSNIGHCLTAAGVSAFIKAVLAVEHRQLPPTIHFERLNDHIRLEGSPFYVNTSLQAWMPRGASRRHAAVSSFGYSGTNAHIVLGEYVQPRRALPATLPTAFIVPLSAKTKAQLTESARALLGFVQRHGDTVELADLAYTLQVGRTAMEERLGFVVASMAQLADRLRAWLAGERDLPDCSAGQVQKHRDSLSLIDQDEEFKAALLDRWMAQQKYPQLLALWAKGLALEWHRLYAAGTPRRIALPTYPFARERYWIELPDGAPATVPAAASHMEAPTHLFFEERWIEDAGAQGPHQATDELPGSVILVAPAHTAWALPGASRIDDASALASAVDHAYAQTGRPVTVVCATASGRQRDGIHVLFDLFKRIRACGSRVRHVLLVGLYDATRREGIWDMAWIGFERSLRTAMPDVNVSLLYTDDNTSPGLHVADALRSGGVVAYRDGKRCVLSLDRVAAPAAAPSPRLKQHGQYLITGGCGALGGLFARYLAQTCQARLILLGRRPHSDEIERQLAALRAEGAQAADYVSLDITDSAAVAAWARTLPLALTGVIHAAGVSQAQAFHEKTAADIDAVLGPKTTGTWVLDEALSDQPLDIVCYFSSSSAMLGDAGACDYAIANRFLMHYGEYRAQAGFPGKTVVVNWPLWDARTTAGTGMGPQTPAQTAFYLKSSGQSVLKGSDGLDIWTNLLGTDRAQTLVMAGQPSRIVPLLGRLYGTAAETAAPAVATAVPTLKSPMRNSMPSTGDWHERLRDQVRQQVAQTLELSTERLNDETNLADYGFDSISLTQLAKNLQSALAVDVTPALFFNRPNVQSLVEYFAAEFAAHFEAQHRQVASLPAPDAPAADSTPAQSEPPAAFASPAHARLDTSVSRPSANGQGAAASRIAIVGMSGRFPKAADANALWALLAQARSGIDEVPASRWNWREYFVAPGHRDNRIHTRYGGFLDGMDTFDPLFFEVSPAEAEEMDPSERLLMMEAYRAIEDAGIAPASLRGRNVGVFVGMEESQYSLVTEAPGVTTLGAAMISSRLSYFLDLRGPALATNTACSSGLLALHQAVSSLQQGECESAIAASVALSLSPRPWAKMSEAGMLSPDGQCRSFSRQADGIGIGEAVVAFMLMPLQAALDQGLPVYGVIRGSGTNFDGKTNGVTAPNGRAQEQLIETVYARHDIDVRDVSHVVAHGTGTRLGDPVELNALDSAFKTLARQRTHDDGKAPLPCAVTSVKSNLGHTMAASGLVSLAALLQGMAHRQIPATLHCEEDNDYIAWRDSRLYVNKTTRSWDVPGDRLRVGAVSAFGRSGTNAHVVIEEFRDRRTQAGASAAGVCLVPLSARTSEQLRQRAEGLLAFLGRADDRDLAAVALTLQEGRDAFSQRLAVVATSCAQLRRALEDWLAGKPSDGVVAGSVDWRHAGNTDTSSPAPIGRDAVALAEAAQAWVRGDAIAWAALRDRADAPARVRLPTYPFAQDRYWIEETPSPVVTAPSSAIRRKSVSIEDILDQVDAGTLAGGEAAAVLKTMAGGAR